MNKKVLRTMIALVMIFLLGLYVLKIFFPEQFVFVINNQNLIAVGDFIGERWWLQEICDIFASFITYWLYLGATLRKWRLGWKEIIAVLITIAITHGLYFVDVTLASGLSIVAMLIVPAIFKAKLSDVAIVFSIHYMSQLLSTLIRGLPLLLVNINYITILFLTGECYFWLLLFYLYFNYRGKEKHEV